MPTTDPVDLDDPDAIIRRLIELDEENRALNDALRAVTQRQQAEYRLRRLAREKAQHARRGPRAAGEGAAAPPTA
jgi:hypothetical protein